MFLTKNPERYAHLDALALLPHEENFWCGTTVTNTHLSIEPLHEYIHAGLGSFGSSRLSIIGAETGKITQERAWVDNICEAADIAHAAVFMKDSLKPIVGEENMIRQFPWEA